MRILTTALGLSALLMMTGCKFPNPNPKPPPPPPPPVSAAPSAEVLVQNINANALLIRSVESRIDIDAEAEGQRIGLNGTMSAQQPLNFRMRAKFVSKPVLDLGSNATEFWFWANPMGEPQPLLYCAYADLASGKAKMPLPFQPEWVIETLAMKERDPRGSYEVTVNPTTLELVEQTTSPQGQPVRKVTVFNRTPLKNGQYQVVSHHLKDVEGKTICSAIVKDTYYDQNSGALMPSKLDLTWPAQKLALTLALDRPVINGNMDQTRVNAMFTRPNMPRSMDMARMPAETMSHVKQAQAGGYVPPRR